MGLGRVLEGLVIFLYYLQLIFEPYSSCIFALPQNPTTITKSQFSNQVISLVIKEIILVCKFFREIFFLIKSMTMPGEVLEKWSSQKMSIK